MKETSVKPSNTSPIILIGDNIVRAERVAQLLGISISTLYDWKYRAKKKGIPPDMFLKVNGKMLYVRMNVLKEWMGV